LLGRLLPTQELFTEVRFFGWNFGRELWVVEGLAMMELLLGSIHNSNIIKIIEAV
jgi:hypothetical protein